MENLDIDTFLANYSAIYLTEASLGEDSDLYTRWFGADWRTLSNHQSGQLAHHPGVFAGEEFIMNGDSVVEAAARGRKAAIEILQFLNEQI